MEACDPTATELSPLSISVSPSPSSPSPPTKPFGATPCSACKILRRRCSENCTLAPHFPPSEPLKFAAAHRVFGASNVVKFLKDLQENWRADAVSSMVYEANARIKDPVYGCAGTICHLQKQVMELQTQLAKAQAELVNMQTQQSNLHAFISKKMKRSSDSERLITQPLAVNFTAYPNAPSYSPNHSFLNENSNNPGLAWGPL